MNQPILKPGLLTKKPQTKKTSYLDQVLPNSEETILISMVERIQKALEKRKPTIISSTSLEAKKLSPESSIIKVRKSKGI